MKPRITAHLVLTLSNRLQVKGGFVADARCGQSVSFYPAAHVIFLFKTQGASQRILRTMADYSATVAYTYPIGT